MDNNKIHDALRRIGLALNACNNCITTDISETEEDKTHWRIDHSQEINDLEDIKKVLIDTGIYHECNCCNKSP